MISVQGLAANRSLGGEKNCIVSSWFRIFILSLLLALLLLVLLVVLVFPLLPY